jgi:hypothetical protein
MYRDSSWFQSSTAIHVYIPSYTKHPKMVKEPQVIYEERKKGSTFSQKCATAIPSPHKMEMTASALDTYIARCDTACSMSISLDNVQCFIIMPHYRSSFKLFYKELQK